MVATNSHTTVTQTNSFAAAAKILQSPRIVPNQAHNAFSSFSLSDITMHAASLLLLLALAALTLARPVPVPGQRRSSDSRHFSRQHPAHARAHPNAPQPPAEEPAVVDPALNADPPAVAGSMMLFGSSIDDDAVFHKLMEWKD